MTAVTPAPRGLLVVHVKSESARSVSKQPSLRAPASATAGPTTPTNYKHGKWDIYFLGITIVIGGQYFCWNAGISAGLYSFLIAYFLVAFAYIALCCCTAEITGALPFAGGAYGLARCTLGFYPAYMIGCCEVFEYIAYVSTSTISFIDLIVNSIPALAPYRPLLWAVFYVTALSIHLNGSHTFWRFNLGIGVLSLAIVVLYCLGSLPYVSFSDYAVDSNLEFVDGFSGFMKALPLAAWFFVGVEALSLASDQVDQPKKIIPVAQVSCVVTLFVTGLAVFLVTVSLPPGLASLPSELVPFDAGFTRLFKISREASTVLSLPATYATAFGFMWCYGQLIAAMGMSRLLPPFLAKTTEKDDLPYVALLAGSAVSYALCLAVYFVPSIGAYLFNICVLAAFMAYTGQCIGYVSLKRNYRNIKSSQFQSPWGIPGAIFSMGVWLLCIVAIAGFQGNGGVEVFAFLTLWALLTLFYVAYARKRQTFSAQENRVMLVAHITKFNIKKVRHKHQSRSGTSGTSGSRQPSAKGTEISQTENVRVKSTKVFKPSNRTS